MHYDIVLLVREWAMVKNTKCRSRNWNSLVQIGLEILSIFLLVIILINSRSLASSEIPPAHSANESADALQSQHAHSPQLTVVVQDQPEVGTLSAEQNNQIISERATIAAERQAEAAEKQLRWIVFQFILSALGVFGLIITLYHNKKSISLTIETANAARLSVAISERALELDQRPWLSVVANLDGVIFHKDEVISIPISFSVSNSGKSAALNVWVAVEFKPHMLDVAIWDLQRDFSKEIMDAFSERMKEDDPVLGYPVLPGSTHVEKRNIQCNSSDLSRSSSIEPRWMMQPFIIGCVVYRSANARAPKQTGFIFEFKRSGELIGGYVDLNPARHPIADLDIQPYFVGGNAT